MKLILNPALLYAALWSMLLFLYKIRLSDLLLPLSTESFLFFASSIIFFLVGYVFYVIVTRKVIVSPKINYPLYKEWIFSKHISNVLNKLSIILIVGLSLETIYFQNIPLLSLLGIGKQIRYTEFGFPGIHGLFNAILLVIVTILFVRQLINPSKLNLLLIVIALSWPVLLVTRQLFITIAVQLLLLYILLKAVNIKSIVKIIVLVLTLIFVFGYIGDLRSSRLVIIALAQPTIDYPDYLPSGLLWVYIYMVSPLNNVVNNINVTPYYAPIGTIGSLVPSFARDYFIQLLGFSPPEWELVNETLNVSSFHQKFLIDYGPFISVYMYSFISFFSFLVVNKASNDPRYGLALIVILHAIIFSFFTDFFFHLVFVAQFVFYITLFKNAKLHA